MEQVLHWWCSVGCSVVDGCGRGDGHTKAKICQNIFCILFQPTWVGCRWKQNLPIWKIYGNYQGSNSSWHFDPSLDATAHTVKGLTIAWKSLNQKISRPPKSHFPFGRSLDVAPLQLLLLCQHLLLRPQIAKVHCGFASWVLPRPFLIWDPDGSRPRSSIGTE